MRPIKFAINLLQGSKIWWPSSTATNWFYVYESKPISKLKYVLFLDHPYKMGEVIPYTSYGTDSFNNCSMHRNYAYPIKEIFEINHPIDLATLRTIGITPPQNYLYVVDGEKL